MEIAIERRAAATAIERALALTDDFVEARKIVGARPPRGEPRDRRFDEQTGLGDLGVGGLAEPQHQRERSDDRP
jgi:hypothetical protein